MFLWDKNIFPVFNAYLSLIFFLFNLAYSESERACIKYCATNMPTTARKESQRPISYTAFGETSKIINKEKNNVVSKSLSSCNTNARYTMAVIIKALTVDVANPVKAR